MQPTRTRTSADTYFQSPEYSQHDLIQLIDGEIVVGMSPVPRHQIIVGEILFLLMTVARRTGGRAITAPVEVLLDAHNVFEPDVLYLRPDSACSVGEKRLTGTPDLVVEVLSPATARYDRQQKFHAYEQHGVAEYWIVDPLHEVVEVWVLSAERFQLQGAYAGADIFTSPTLGEPVAAATIFRP